MAWYWSISDIFVLSQIGLTLIVGAMRSRRGN